MIVAVLILALGISDLVGGLWEWVPERTRERTSRRVRMLVVLVGGAAALLCVGGLGYLGFGLPIGVTLLISVLGLTWVVISAWFSQGGSGMPLLVGAVALVVVGTPLFAFGDSIESNGPLVSLYMRFTEDASINYPAELVVGAVGAAVFLTRSVNLICKAALRRALSEDVPELRARHGEKSREVRVAVGSVKIATLSVTPASAELPESDEFETGGRTRLLGGRLIGPLERLMITALALSGAHALIVGLVAAKGVVRFPEIAADGRQGSKAEEFLVGSLISWSAAGLAVALLQGLA